MDIKYPKYTIEQDKRFKMKTEERLRVVDDYNSGKGLYYLASVYDSSYHTIRAIVDFRYRETLREKCRGRKIPTDKKALRVCGARKMKLQHDELLEYAYAKRNARKKKTKEVK